MELLCPTESSTATKWSRLWNFYARSKNNFIMCFMMIPYIVQYISGGIWGDGDTGDKSVQFFCSDSIGIKIYFRRGATHGCW